MYLDTATGEILSFMEWNREQRMDRIGQNKGRVREKRTEGLGRVVEHWKREQITPT